MNGDRRSKNKCPDCGGDLISENGKIECVKCDYRKDEQRKKIEDALNEWLNV